ncbi:hypothetical protein JDV02_003245 [Purpureocillium takamizusanense]|uniref:Uncharacterized protein n=1 Tax=Purpureocillium takamizusanense TaxID=2060973 RepID=A0A9Q8V9G7_9HYPO|nr:uncharacterized protein JDV02_003245 [Purpureocillium takamizusanense]UNI16849.1 hypothetical protein JDV02_003245 [Purpureocillium takamizusanense]
MLARERSNGGHERNRNRNLFPASHRSAHKPQYYSITPVINHPNISKPVLISQVHHQLHLEIMSSSSSPTSMPIHHHHHYRSQEEEQEEEKAKAAPPAAPAAHPDANAARAMDHTNSWKPSLDRRQSWSKEDQKHALQMSSLDGVKAGPGFTEK